ncbi:hypothetical protein LCGC14_0379000 [marine sediment metagenome]|uniref:Uncharacterized protein n=1 Tax=marine sediment metagenome TaxID=412755 RepID=A0A0F9T2Y0_9ZZZZ
MVAYPFGECGFFIAQFWRIMSQQNITDETEEVTTEATEQWASDSDRLAQEGAPEADAPPSTEAELPPEPSPELVAAQTQIAELTREREERAQEANAAAIEGNSRDMADRYAQNLVANGNYTEEQARAQAESERLRWVAEERLKLSDGRVESLHLAYGAKDLARTYGISEESLQGFSTIDQMEKYARVAGSQDKRISALEQGKRNEAAPVQPYATQASPGASGDGSYVTKLKSGGALPSSSEIDQITAKFLQQ